MTLDSRPALVFRLHQERAYQRLVFCILFAAACLFLEVSDPVNTVLLRFCGVFFLIMGVHVLYQIATHAVLLRVDATGIVAKRQHLAWSEVRSVVREHRETKYNRYEVLVIKPTTGESIEIADRDLPKPVLTVRDLVRQHQRAYEGTD